MNKQSGFTLIELVIVVVILGFLAVTAIPKFIDLTEQAKQANIEGMAGGFATGISLARSQWEVDGRSHDTNNKNFVNYDGTTLFLTVEAAGIRPGYVVGLASKADDLSGLIATDCSDVWNNILQQPPTNSSVFADINATNNNINYYVSKSGTGAATLCHYYLKETLTRDAASGNYIDPNNATNVGNSFTYQPSNSSVIVYITNN